MAKRAQQFGFVLQHLAKFTTHKMVPIAPLVRQLDYAESVGQLKVYFNSYQACVGYVVWAQLADDLHQEFSVGKFRQLEPWQFNEGPNLWILDFAVSPGSLTYVLEDLRDKVFASHSEVFYPRRKGNRLRIKQLSRSDRSAFMKDANVS